MKNRTLIIFLILLTLGIEVSAQHTYTSPDNTLGLDWDDVGTWTKTGAGGGSQVTPENPTHSSLSAVDLYGFVIVNSGLTIANNSPAVTIYDTLYIKGDFTLNQGNLSVPAGGVLIIEGDVNAGNGLGTLDNQGSMVVTGDFNLSNGTVTTNDNFYVYGSSSVSGGATINGENPYSGPDPVDNLGDEDDLIADNSGLHDFVSSGGVLPIELIYFRGIAKNSKVIFKWATASQKNFSHFEIENAGNDLKFQKIAHIEGDHESSSVLEYEYSWLFNLSLKPFFRLKSVDLDGTHEYFSVLAIEPQGSDSGVKAFPNPVLQGEIITVQCNLCTAESQLTILDSNGRPIYRINKMSEQVIQLQPNIAPGFYFLKATTINGDIHQRFIIE